MNKAASFLALAAFTTACGSGDSDTTGNPTPNPPQGGAPTVQTDSTYAVLQDTDVTFAEGLAHDETSVSPSAVPLKLDMYYPDTDSGKSPRLYVHSWRWV